MIKNILTTMVVVLLACGAVGCNTVGKMLPANDRVLVYDLPYDLTYLRTMETLDGHGNWQLADTDKEQGTLSVRDTNYSRLDDSDCRVIKFLVKHVGRNRTSVSIDPDSQKVIGGDKLLDAIGGALGREIRS